MGDTSPKLLESSGKNRRRTLPDFDLAMGKVSDKGEMSGPSASDDPGESSTKIVRSESCRESGRAVFDTLEKSGEGERD